MSEVNDPPQNTRLFQINEDDLATLEKTLPDLADALMPFMSKDDPRGNRLRVQIRRVQRIVADVRWNYGPPADVGIIPAE